MRLPAAISHPTFVALGNDCPGTCRHGSPHRPASPLKKWKCACFPGVQVGHCLHGDVWHISTCWHVVRSELDIGSSHLNELACSPGRRPASQTLSGCQAMRGNGCAMALEGAVTAQSNACLCAHPGCPRCSMMHQGPSPSLPQRHTAGIACLISGNLGAMGA